ncbi:hypothetical protein FOZ63_015261 [Perkinsus olseni]|uniref:Sugar phosphate transporter domain-containing protein n=1 Tax=Perkinsus olseni TaxID=32597 RepID=A0A7J6NIE7_PEROL|nr:hypothetical protein FOZ63_015261 [Perkinsus olseni]
MMLSKAMATPKSSLRYRSTVMLIHYIGSLSLAWINKLAFIEGFKWASLLTALSNLFIFATFELAIRRRLIIGGEPLPLVKVLPISVAFCGFVIFNNFSLDYNDPGVYELTKVLVTPAILLVQNLLYSIAVPPGQGLTLFAMVVGMVLATVSSFNFNVLGSLWGLLSVACAALYQVLVCVTPKQAQCRPLQLLHRQSLVTALLLFMVIPLLEDVSEILDLVVNATIFVILIEVSPLSYNVLCNAEVCLVLSIGYLIFGDPLTIKSLVGVSVASLSVAWFTRLKLEGIIFNRYDPVGKIDWTGLSAPKIDPFDRELDGGTHGI